LPITLGVWVVKCRTISYELTSGEHRDRVVDTRKSHVFVSPGGRVKIYSDDTYPYSLSAEMLNVCFTLEDGETIALDEITDRFYTVFAKANPSPEKRDVDLYTYSSELIRR